MQTTHSIPELDIKKVRLLKRRLSTYTKRIHEVIVSHDYTKHESALAIASDRAYQTMVRKKIAHLMGATHVILIGIGGSSAGVEAVYNALPAQKAKKFLVLDAIEEHSIVELKSFLSNVTKLESIAVVVVSKSGSTTETLVNAVETIEIETKKFGQPFLSRVVFVSNKGGKLLELGKKKRITCVPIPESIGGRYSVFTAVGVVPLLLLGVDVESFLKGAALFFSGLHTEEIESHAIALTLLAEEKNIHTVNFFAFDERFAYLGLWYRQLLAESIGKPITKKKKPFKYQLLPIVSSSSDLHSIAQLYLGGYKGIYTHFFFTEREEESLSRSMDHWLFTNTSHLKNHSLREVKDAIREGVIASYTEEKLPFSITKFTSDTAFEIGECMAARMYEVMLLAQLLDVNAFDQPNVESYKKHTHTHLSA